MNIRTNMLAGLSLAVMTTAQAQSWCPPGARWLFDTGSPWAVGQTQVTYVGDTVVDGYTAQKLERHYKFVQIFGSDSLIEGYRTPWITRVEGDMVLDKVEGVWDTLFRFDAVPGDHWQPNWLDGIECPDYTLHVIDTSLVVFSGVALRQVELEVYQFGVPMGWFATFTERFGGAFWLGPPPCTTYECFCSPLCYQDNEMFNPLNPCTFTVGVEDLQAGEDTPLQISHLGSEIVVAVPSAMIGSELSIHDPTGRVVQQQVTTGANVLVPIAGFPAGAYIASLRAKGRSLQGRFILP